MSGASQVIVATVPACQLQFQVTSHVNHQVAVAVQRTTVHPAKVNVLAECVRVTSAVDGAEFQVITLQLPRNKSDQAIAVVHKASVLSVSDTRVVFIATAERFVRDVFAPAHHQERSTSILFVAGLTCTSSGVTPSTELTHNNVAFRLSSLLAFVILLKLNYY